jgi:hypothetical protein
MRPVTWKSHALAPCKGGQNSAGQSVALIVFMISRDEQARATS